MQVSYEKLKTIDTNSTMESKRKTLRDSLDNKNLNVEIPSKVYNLTGSNKQSQRSFKQEARNKSISDLKTISHRSSQDKLLKHLFDKRVSAEPPAARDLRYEEAR